MMKKTMKTTGDDDDRDACLQHDGSFSLSEKTLSDCVVLAGFQGFSGYGS